MDIASRIKELCMIKKISSMYELGKLSGVPQSTLQSILSGVSPKADTIEKICLGLGVTMSDFFAVDEDRSFEYDVSEHANKMMLNEEQKATLEIDDKEPLEERQKRLLLMMEKIKSLTVPDQEALFQLIDSLSARK